VKPETDRGIQLAEGDLQMAAYARRRRLNEQCIYHCHQALAKLLKAIWTERHTSSSVPKTHNLGSLSIELFPDLGAEDHELLQRIGRQYLPSRYAEYDPQYSRDEVAELHRGTQRIYAWLRQQLS
jgi:HEPN domain-containing protein